MAFLPKVKEAMEYIGSMTPATAVALVRALEPILRLQPSLRDYLMIILRKSLFSREPESRLVALDCLLHLSMLVPRASSHGVSSQFSASQVPDSAAVEDVGLEVVGQLRQCMAQGATMRQRLYSGFCDVVRKKPKLLEYISNTVVLHMKRYCQDNPEGRVLMLDRCLDEGKAIAEPIAHLLHAITQCIIVHAASDEGEQSAMAVDAEHDVMSAARSQMNKLLNWIASSELEDLDLHRDTAFNLETEQGRKAWNTAKLLYGVYEAMLE